MKKHFFLFNLLIAMIIVVLFFVRYNAVSNGSTMSFSDLTVLPAVQLDDIKREKTTVIDDLVEFDYDSFSIAYDRNMDTYYLPVNMDFDKFNIHYNKNVTIRLSEELTTQKLQEKVKNGEPVDLIAYNDSSYQLRHIVFTGLPLMTLKSGMLNDLTVYEPNIDSNKDSQVISTWSVRDIRGNSSRLYDKKSYKLSIVDESAHEKSISLLNLGSASTFALNSLYEDDSKIRDKLSADMWELIGAADNLYGIYNGTKLNYVEVFIDNNYWGLYGLMLLLDDETLSLSSEKTPPDILFRITDPAIPEPGDLLDSNTLESGSIDILYPVTQNVHGLWDVMEDFVELIYYADDSVFSQNMGDIVDIDNCVDYVLLTQLMYGFDNTWKNGYFSYRSDGRFLLTPWDCDLTWGAVWDKTSNLFVSLDISTALKPLNFPLGDRLHDNDVGNFREKLISKWTALRQNELSTEELIAYADDLFDSLNDTGAYARDRQRWPDGAYTDSNRFIRTFIEQRLPYLDDYLANNTKWSQLDALSQ